MLKPTPPSSVRARLLQAADELFYAEGVHVVGIDRVLQRAGVARASLYSTFGSKEELVREYLRGRDERLRARIEGRLATIDDPRARILAVFEGLKERIAEGSYAGCPFIRASAEGEPGPNAAREASAVHRTWRRDLFQRLASEAGVADARSMSVQLGLLYDGAAISWSMDNDARGAEVARRAADQLLDAAIETKKTRAPVKRSVTKKTRPN